MNTILYKSCSIKQILFNYIRNQSENDYIPQESENLKFTPIIKSFTWLVHISTFKTTFGSHFGKIPALNE